ncbi:MAG: phage tail sheath subtilisin-like domain-containing protein, partial [Gemmatimonadota bacterium]
SERASNDGDSRLVVMSDRTFAPDGTPEADAGTRRMGIPAEGTALALTGGADDFAGIDDAVVVGDTAADPDDRSGIQSFLNHEDIDLVAAPGRTSATVQAALVAHCERMRHRFAVLETPQAADVAGAHLHRQSFDTDHGAIFHPWLLVPDPFGAAGALRRVPPSGHVMGIYARSDREHGVWKAPANEIVRGIHALERDVTAADQDVLNPAHVNCIRDFRSAGRGIRLWGARTLSSDPEWKYVNVRRLVMFLEHSIGKGTEWAVFEPNAQPLWTAVEGAITTFLSSIWRSGGLNGATQRDAFFVKVGPNVTMTQHDIDEGRLVVEVGVAPLKPAEFVIFRIVQKTADAAD